MKKILFIAVLTVTVGSIFTSCDKDGVVENTNKAHIKNDYQFLAKEQDTLGDGDTGGQGGSTSNPKP